MMKTKFIFLVFALSLGALSACSEAFPTSELAYMEATERYVKNDALTFNGKYSPYDFISLNDKIVATDSENDCLLIIDKKNGDIQTKGQTGNGNDDYLNPHGIHIKDDLIYVVDSGNNRIKILNTNLDCVNLIYISNITFGEDASAFVDDISVDDDGTIFFTVNTCIEKNAKLYCIEQGSDNPKVIVNNCTGVVTSYGNKTYFANTFEFTNSMERRTGNSYIYEIENNEVVSSYLLPEKYAPIGLYVDESGLYCSSLTYREISKIDFNSMNVMPFFAEEILINESKDELKKYGSLIYSDNCFWLIETNHNSIYMLKEE